MATAADQITETYNPCSDVSEIDKLGSEHDPETIRRTNPGVKRLILTLSVLFSFILGSPFLFKSVEIYRSPLPFRDVDLLSDTLDAYPLLFPCHLQVILLGFSHENPNEYNPQDLQILIGEQIRKLTPDSPACGGCGNNFTVSIAVQSSSTSEMRSCGGADYNWFYGELDARDFGDKDDDVDEKLGKVLSKCGRVYSVVAANVGDGEVRAVVGKYRHAWMVGGFQKEGLIRRVAEIFVKVFVNGGKEEEVIKGEFMPVGADGRIVLSFSLLNANPQDWVYDWDFNGVDKILLAPIVEALGHVANISIESQVLYHTPKASFSYWNDEWQSYIVSSKDLPFFVNSNEWHLDTSIAAGGRSKILHIAVYVPSAEECPLLLQFPGGGISKTNGFISPMWGGVIVWNPPNCSRGSKVMHPPRLMIPIQDLAKIFEVFMGQLRQLFGLKSDDIYVGASGTYNLLTSEKGFAEWELDALSRQHTCFNLYSCATTLKSLSSLVQSLPRMIITDEIGKQVKFSLEAAELAQVNAFHGVYNASAVASRQAISLAEDAFFHPSISSVSYFSFEHCFAVYSPFFLPVSLHVLLAALREWRRYRRENKKYAEWKKAKER